MRRRTLLGLLAALPVVALANGFTITGSRLKFGRYRQQRGYCPICGGLLVFAGRIRIDPSVPSPNLVLWNGSEGDFAGPNYGPRTPYCPECHAAYSRRLDTWVRTSELADAFAVPLAAAIAGFPLPRPLESGLAYSQEFAGADAGGGRRESVLFRASESPGLRARLQAYATAHGLSLEFHPARDDPRRLSVLAEAAPAAFAPAPAD